MGSEAQAHTSQPGTTSCFHCGKECAKNQGIEGSGDPGYCPFIALVNNRLKL